ncbi:MAG: hypothetical protein CVV13_01040 [Gammaproteobacteria bacterium HGW-Gammaproteobacteria-3]|nr:MAG: hypothetical protein CVV13_01040 [Gammaproteobacteria bacterium HGW-Gammaproteobacteria-3]
MNKPNLAAWIRTLDVRAIRRTNNWHFGYQGVFYSCRQLARDGLFSIQSVVTAIDRLGHEQLLFCLGNQCDMPQGIRYAISDQQLIVAFEGRLEPPQLQTFMRVVTQLGQYVQGFEHHGLPPIHKPPLQDWPKLLKALSDPTRLRLVAELLKTACCVEDLASRLKLTHYNTSKHLRILRQAGVIESRRDGRLVISTIAEPIRNRVKSQVLDLGCCRFQFDQHPMNQD